MKILLKILVGLVVAIIFILFCLQIFLNHGLNPVVQQALPQISKRAGTDIGLGDLSINLFGGALRAEKLTVANPPGFEPPNIISLDKAVLDVSLPALLGRVVRVSDVRVDNAVFMLVRNAAGRVNLQQLLEQQRQQNPATNRPPQTAENQPAKPTETPDKTEPVELPKFQLDRLAFSTLFEYVDYKTDNQKPLKLGLDLNLDAAGIVTFGDLPEAQWGTLAITGGAHNNPDTFVIDIQNKVAPLTDPALPSFRTDGQIVSVNLEELGSVADEIGITSRKVDLTLKLIVDKGVFQKGSELVATAHDARLTGKLQKKYKHVKLLPDLSITIPVSGTLAKPKVYILQAVTTSVLRNLKNNPDYLLENVSIDGKSLGEHIDKKLNKGLNKLFKKHH